MDDSYNRALGSPSLANNNNKQSPLMQFTKADSNSRQNFNHISNNNNDNIFSVDSKQSFETNIQNNNKGSNDDHLTGSSSPHLSSDSSVSSHAQNNNDDCDIAARATNSSPSSPQSSLYNSSYGSNSGRNLVNSSNNSITALVPGGVVTTQNISTVIRPKSNNNSLQFVKIQTPELSKKAVEQIKLSEEIKSSKIKEVEEEWQNNLLNWKSKRRQQFNHTVEYEPNNLFESADSCGGRKIKTFAEMIEQRAKSGNRLGFHLQRYIGADDDEDGSLSNGRETKDDFTIEPDQSKNRADSDYEAHSSTSSGYNQPDSKSPHSPDTLPDIHKATDSPKTSGRHASRCDSNSGNSPRDETDTISISLIESSDSNQLNSTLKQDIQSPSTNLNNKTNPVLDVDTKTNEVSARSEDESDNSCFEEEEEEQEEEEQQKQLQRIAFEAKLKAFEKLTKPATHTQKFIPNRIVIKTPLTAQKKSPMVNFTSKERQQQTPPSVKESSFSGNSASVRPMVNDDRLHSSSDSSMATSSPDIKSEDSSGEVAQSSDLEHKKPATKPPLPSKESFCQPHQRTRNDTTNIDISPKPLVGPTVMTTVNLAQRIKSIEPRNCERVDQSSLAECISNIDLNLNLNDPSARMTQETNVPTLDRTNSNGSQSSSQSELNMRQLPYSNNFNHVQPNFPPPARYATAQNEPPPVNNNSIPTLPSVVGFHQGNIVPKQRSISTQPLPESPKSVSSSRKASRDDKDRTVLSVSGKKRCSSCKEELGRGAAAFVVESLSLVYHTNCFRCSVCHVNLSNGFRGVDVRVHAGALHCQNCYSKDGLNYSRV